MKKHSYRELSKRRFAGWVLFYLQDPQDAKTVFKSIGKSNAAQRDINSIQNAYSVAEVLIQQHREGTAINLHQFSPYKIEIKEALNNLMQPVKQTELFTN